MLAQNSRQYEAGQIVAPRVSDIIQSYLGEDYSGVPRHILDKASARGTAVHNFFGWFTTGSGAQDEWAKWMEYLSDWDADQHAAAMCAALTEFAASNTFKVAAVEAPIIGHVLSESGQVLYYGGTLDAAVEVDGPETWDIKCTAKLNKQKVALQATAYSMAREQAEFHDLHATGIRNRVLHVTKKKAKIIELDRLDDEWTQAVRFYYGER